VEVAGGSVSVSPFFRSEIESILERLSELALIGRILGNLIVVAGNAESSSRINLLGQLFLRESLREVLRRKGKNCRKQKGSEEPEKRVGCPN